MLNYAIGTTLSVLLLIHSRRKKSLSPDGAAGAFVLGVMTFSSPLIYFSTILAVFFFASSRLTKYKAERKRQLEADYEHSSERTLIQVISNGLTGGVIVVLFRYLFASETSCFDDSRIATALLWAYIGHYGCCNGDTWASELGILSQDEPFLITQMRKVPRGTNGGVSSLGLFASFAGGSVIGLVGALSLYVQQQCGRFAWEMIVVGVFAGIGGSLIDSLLGATVQETLYSKKLKKIVPDRSTDANAVVVCGRNIMDNHQVNLVSSLLTAVLCGAAGYYL